MNVEIELIRRNLENFQTSIQVKLYWSRYYDSNFDITSEKLLRFENFHKIVTCDFERKML